MSRHQLARQLHLDWVCSILFQMSTTSYGVSFGYSLIVGHRPGRNRDNSFSDGIAVAEEEILGGEVEFVDICEISNTVSYPEHCN